MTNKIQEKKEIFLNKKAEYDKIRQDDNKLYERLNIAEENIVSLQEEMDSLKQQRPAMLADNKDITSLNKRLKAIEEEIEINKDTITGIADKRKSMHNLILNLRQEANKEFQNYIKEILTSIRKDYMKLAPKLAEILKDYITLEAMRDGDGTSYACFGIQDINRLPNFDDERNPLFEYQYYRVAGENRDRVREKYDIPDYDMQRVRLTEYLND